MIVYYFGVWSTVICWENYREVLMRDTRHSLKLFENKYSQVQKTSTVGLMIRAEKLQRHTQRLFSKTTKRLRLLGSFLLKTLWELKKRYHRVHPGRRRECCFNNSPTGAESQASKGLDPFDFFVTQEKTRWRFSEQSDCVFEFSFVTSEERKEVGNIEETNTPTTTFSIRLHPSSIKAAVERVWNWQLRTEQLKMSLKSSIKIQPLLHLDNYTINCCILIKS